MVHHDFHADQMEIKLRTMLTHRNVCNALCNWNPINCHTKFQTAYCAEKYFYYFDVCGKWRFAMTKVTLEQQFQNIIESNINHEGIIEKPLRAFGNEIVVEINLSVVSCLDRKWWLNGDRYIWTTIFSILVHGELLMLKQKL